MHSMKKLLGLFVVAAVGGTAAAALTLHFAGKETVIVEQPVQAATWPVRTASPAGAPAPVDFTVAAAKTVDAVVHVKTATEMEAIDNPWFEFFGYESESQIQQGSGSGVIISPNGYIVTNNHVIEGATEIEVSLNDNRTFSAEVIGADPATDLALLKVDEDALPVVGFGDSDEVQVGEWVLAVGNPFDLTSTVTAGIVSAKARNINLLRPDINRDIFPIESFIQTDAAVNPGNSGGALVNASGELVGINTAIASRTGSFSGYSFAVPVSIVEKVTKDLMEYGMVQRAFIGVSIGNVNQAIAEDLGMDEVSGVYVTGLTEGGAAGNAGIEAGDVIIGVDGRKVTNVPELQEEISKYRPGDEVSVSLWRGSKVRKVNVTLRNRQGNEDLVMAPTEREVEDILAAEFEAVSAEEARSLGIRGGAKVAELRDGKLRNSGVRANFIITKVDGEAVSSAEDLNRILADKQGGVLLEGVYPNGQKAYYGFGL